MLKQYEKESTVAVMSANYSFLKEDSQLQNHNIWIGDDNLIKSELYALEILHDLGYKMDEVGTHFYKNMIVKITEKLIDLQSEDNDLSMVDLRAEVKNDYSSFYIQLAEDDLWIGIKTFHRFVIKANEKINYENIDVSMHANIFSDSFDQVEYKEKAFLIAMYINNSLRFENNALAKIKSFKL